MRISNSIRAVVLIMISICLCFVGCNAKTEMDDSFGKDFAPVMAGVSNNNTNGTSTNKPQNTDKPNPYGKKRVATLYQR